MGAMHGQILHKQALPPLKITQDKSMKVAVVLEVGSSQLNIPRLKQYQELLGIFVGNTVDTGF